jgi:hypothetical protein
VPWDRPLGLSLPPNGGKAEMQSFAYHIKYFNRGHVKPIIHFDKLEELYHHARWQILKNWLSRDAIRQKILNLNMKGSTGEPHMRLSQIVSEFIARYGIDVIIDMVLKRIEEFISGNTKGDPIRLFIKQEPHTNKKLDDKAFRLIWSIGVIDQIVHSMVFDDSLESEIVNHRKIPSKVGMSFMKGGANDIVKNFNGFDKVASTDKSKNDWTTPGWAYDVDAEMRRRLCTNWGDKLFEKLFYAVYENLKGVGVDIMFSNGVVLTQQLAGIMRSGSKITISMNSRTQVVMSIADTIEQTGKYDINQEMENVIGDDHIKGWRNLSVERTIENHAKWGYIIKEIEITSPSKMSFCSHEFVDTGFCFVAIPTNLEKHKFNLKVKTTKKRDELCSMLENYCMEYAFSPHFNLFYNVLNLYFPLKCKSFQYYMSLHTASESFNNRDGGDIVSNNIILNRNAR